MNYTMAIKLLYRTENRKEVVQLFRGNTSKLERELERMARQKVKTLVSMQRSSKFNNEEHENAYFIVPTTCVRCRLPTFRRSRRGWREATRASSCRLSMVTASSSRDWPSSPQILHQAS